MTVTTTPTAATAAPPAARPTPAPVEPATTPATPEPTPAEAGTWSKVSTQKPRVSVANANKTINIAVRKATTAASRRHIIVNRYDERLDPPPGPKDSDAERRLYERISRGKLCNRYHLTGRCDVDDCEFVHGEKLPLAEQQALRNKARLLRCSRGGNCRDLSCISGHVCRITQSGAHCSASRCQFTQTHYEFDMVGCWVVNEFPVVVMHVTDAVQKPAKRIYEDGTEEAI